MVVKQNLLLRGMPQQRFAFPYLTVLIALAVGMLCSFGASAQISNTGQGSTITDNQKVVSDTLGFAEKGTDQSVQISFLNARGEKKGYDTTIAEMHKIGLLTIWDVDLGNMGSAYQSLKAQAELPAQFTLLPNAFNAYRFLKQHISFYNTTKPFSEVHYSVGSKQEQLVELFHTQNIQPNWNFSTRYRKINSLGFFKAQKNNIDNFSFVTNYDTKNARYKVQAAFLYNKLQHDENLGIVSDSFLSERQFRNRSIIPVGVNVANGVVRSPILNYNRDVNVTFQHQYAVGKTSMTLDQDSIQRYSFKPLITFANEVYYTGERYCFKHNDPDSLFRLYYFNQPFSLTDTMTVQYDNKVIGTTISAEGNVYLRRRIFSVLGGLGIEYQKVTGGVRAQDAVNNYLFGHLTNRKSQDSSWKLDAQVKFYYTGMALGNLNLDGHLSKTLPRNIGELGISAGQYIQQPYFVSESIQINASERLQTLKPQINTCLGGYYKNEIWHFEGALNSILYNQLIYSDGLQPNYKQYATPISILQIVLQKDFYFGNWVSSNQVLVQLSPKKSPVQIPLVSSFHRLAFNDYLFKGKLAVSTGLDVYYNTPYYHDIYQPVFQSFNPQLFQKQQLFPRLNPFFNFKIKRFRASVNFDQVQHYFIKNNLNYPYYAAQNPMFRFGLRWIFVN